MIEVALTVIMVVAVLVTTFFFLGVRFITALALGFAVGILVAGTALKFHREDPFDTTDRSRQETTYAVCALIYFILTFVLLIMAAWRETRRHFAI